MGFTVLLAGALLLTFPLYWMIMNSFQGYAQVIKLPPNLFPREPTLGNWERLFDVGGARWLLNSVIVSSGGLVLGVLGATTAGYAFAKKRFPGRDALFSVYLATMAMPGAVTVIPLFIEMRDLGLINTHLGMFIIHASWPFGAFFARQYLKTIPDELLEAARIDGAGELRTFMSIVLPLARPLVGALSILAFIGTWNNYLWQLLMASDDSMFTVLVGASSRGSGRVVSDLGLTMAAATLAFIPMLLIFLRFQGHFVKGVTTGALNQ